nr:metalloregulator ArsR/SmtB family transcription factor [Magnetospirillum sp. UT-4]
MPAADPGRLSGVAAILKALGNPWRYTILCHLANGESSVGTLVARVGITQSALSQHLARLRDLGLVRTRRQRQRVFYSLAGPAVAGLVASLCDACDEVLAKG